MVMRKTYPRETKMEKNVTYNGFKNYETWWAWFELYDNADMEVEIYKEWKETCPERMLAHYLWDKNEEYMKAEGNTDTFTSILARMAFKRIDWYEVAEQIIENAEAELAEQNA